MPIDKEIEELIEIKIAEFIQKSEELIEVKVAEHNRQAESDFHSNFLNYFDKMNSELGRTQERFYNFFKNLLYIGLGFLALMGVKAFTDFYTIPEKISEAVTNSVKESDIFNETRNQIDWQIEDQKRMIDESEIINAYYYHFIMPNQFQDMNPLNNRGDIVPDINDNKFVKLMQSGLKSNKDYLIDYTCDLIIISALGKSIDPSNTEVCNLVKEIKLYINRNIENENLVEKMDSLIECLGRIKIKESEILILELLNNSRFMNNWGKLLFAIAKLEPDDGLKILHEKKYSLDDFPEFGIALYLFNDQETIEKVNKHISQNEYFELLEYFKGIIEVYDKTSKLRNGNESDFTILINLITGLSDTPNFFDTYFMEIITMEKAQNRILPDYIIYGLDDKSEDQLINSIQDCRNKLNNVIGFSKKEKIEILNYFEEILAR